MLTPPNTTATTDADLFREEAERKKFRYFLEVFDPNVLNGIPKEKLGEFINDMILRSMAGITESNRPLFAVKPGASGDISLKDGEMSSEFVAWYRRQPVIFVTHQVFVCV